MGWYNKNLKKHWKDYGRNEKVLIPLWHISPDKVSVPSAKSTFGGVSGLYFSPTFYSLIKDWAFYVLKKKTKDDLSINRTKLFDLEDKIEDEYENGTRQGNIYEDPEYINITNKIDKMREIAEKPEYIKSRRPYQMLYINRFEFPKWASDEINEWFFGHMQKDKNGMPANLSFWGWGDQIFIPQKYFKYLKHISSKPITIDQLNKLYGEI